MQNAECEIFAFSKWTCDFAANKRLTNGPRSLKSPMGLIDRLNHCVCNRFGHVIERYQE